MHLITAGTTRGAKELEDKMADPWKRKRKDRIVDNQTPSKLNVDVHGILFAIVVTVFVVYPLAQWALGR